VPAVLSDVISLIGNEINILALSMLDEFACPNILKVSKESANPALDFVARVNKSFLNAVVMVLSAFAVYLLIAIILQIL
jgi:7,8-dihydro-6-hydroxymethylpterin-pyrophosphokinase